MRAATLNDHQVGSHTLELRNLVPRHVGNLVPCRVTLCRACIAKLDKMVAVVSKRHIVDRVLVFVTEVFDLSRDGLTETCEP